MILKSDISFTKLIARARWELVSGWRLFFNKYGLFGCVVVVCAAIIFLLLIQKSQASNDVDILQQKQFNLQKNYSDAPIEVNRVDGHIQIKAFQQFLLPYNRIPSAVKDMLQLASKQGLTNLRGDYKAQVDSQGEFLRYQMVIPVTGNIHSINKYIQHVLVAHKTLALENIKFKRERADVGKIEARIQWVLFTRLPTDDDQKNINFNE